MKHLTQCSCISLPDNLHCDTIWTDINTIFRESIVEKVSVVDSDSDCLVKLTCKPEQAELDLSISGEGTHSRAHLGSPTSPLSPPEKPGRCRCSVIRPCRFPSSQVDLSLLVASIQ